MDFRLPNINGNTDREQIAQIKSYLYQLVLQLQWALNGVSSSSSEAVSSGSVSDVATGMPSGIAAQVIFNAIKPLINKEYSATDAVNECGSTDGWTWRKWKSGVYDMFGEFALTTTEAATAHGALYHSEVLTVKLPFAVKSACVMGASPDCPMLVPTMLDNVVDNRIGVSVWSSTSFDVGTVLKVCLHVTGNY